MKTAILLLITGIALCAIGCGEEQQQNTVTAETTGGTALWGEEKLATYKTVSGIFAEGVEVVSNAHSAGAPSIVKQIAIGDTLEIAMYLIETERNGSKIVAVKATSGMLIGNDHIRLYAGNEYVGRVTLPVGASLSEIHIRLDKEDVRDSEAVIESEVSRNGRVIADAELTTEHAGDTAPNLRGIITGIWFESARPGRNKTDIVLVFSDDIHAPQSIKKNFFVVLDGKALPIWSYGESAYELTLVMRKNLIPGTYRIIYNGKGGLRSMNGPKVQKFETTLVIEGAVETAHPVNPSADPTRGANTNATEVPPTQGKLTERDTPAGTNEPTAWRIIRRGLYDSGRQFLLLLDAAGYVVSKWSKKIIGADTFPVEQTPGTTELYRIEVASLGITGTLTAQKIYDAVVKSAVYDPVPPETPAQDRMQYTEQPRGESLLYVTIPLEVMGIPGEVCNLVLGGGNNAVPQQNIYAVIMSTPLSREIYRYVVVTARRV